MNAFAIGPIGDQFADPGTEPRQTYEQAIEVYEEVIVEAWVAAGRSRDAIQRADSVDRPGEIPEQVVKSVLSADLVIADLTGANANAMYELALRHAIGRPSAQIGEKGRLPFDISAIRTAMFVRTPSGLIKARKKLTAAIEFALAGEYDLPTASRVFRSHAGLLLQEGVNAPHADPFGSDEVDESPGDEEDDDAPGYLELRADMEDAMPDVSARLTAISTTTAAVGKLASEETSRIASASSSRDKLVSVNRFAVKLEPLATELDRDSVEFAAKIGVVHVGLSSVFDMISADPDLLDVDAMQFIGTLSGLADAARGSVEGVEGFYVGLEALENASSRLRKPIRLLRGGLRRVLDTYETIYEWGDRARAILDDASD